MALLPSTAATRMVPVAGRQFAERRLIRGVGAAERSVGNAWGKLTSRQREYYGNQKNFAGGLQRESTRRQEQKDAAQEKADRDQGRQDAMQDAPPATPATNHAQSVIAPPSKAAIKKEVDDDMYPEGKPAPKPASQQLGDAMSAGRVKDDADDYKYGRTDEAGDRRIADRGYDGLTNSWIGSTDSNEDRIGRHHRRLAKGYQMASKSRFAERRQVPKPGTYGRIY